VVLPVVGFVASRAGLRQFFFCTAGFPIVYFSAFSRNNLSVYMADVPEFPFWVELPACGIWMFIHALIPLIFLVFFARYRREAVSRPEEPWDRLMLIAIMGFSSFLAIANAPSWFRLCTASLPALILFVWFISSARKLHHVLRRILWFAAIAVAVAEPLMTQTAGPGILETSTGRVALVDPERYEKYRWLAGRVHPGEFFLEGEDADMYFLLDLRNPSEVPFLTATEYTRPEQVERLLAGLAKSRVRYVLWAVSLDLTETGRLNGDRQAGDHLGSLRAYLRDHYRVVKTFDDGAQVWEREGQEQSTTDRR
jgi:hypothetical protein